MRHSLHVMDGDDRGQQGQSNAMKIIEIQVVYEEKLIFEVRVWAWLRLS